MVPVVVIGNMICQTIWVAMLPVKNPNRNLWTPEMVLIKLSSVVFMIGAFLHSSQESYYQAQ